MKISKKIESMQFPPIRKFNPIALKAEEAGAKIYHLNIGQPDIETPKVFMDAIRGYDAKVIKYCESDGIPELKDAIRDYLKNYDMNVERDDIMITTGGSEAISMSFLTMLNEGDEIILAEPFYTNYNTFCKAAGGRIVPITTYPKDGYRYAKRELIEPLITERTRAICCINPCNPTGNVLTMEEMKLIGEIAKEHNLWILADEVYREFSYDRNQIFSFGMIHDIEDRVVIVDSVSKRFSACGARIGYIASKNRDFMSSVMKIAQGRLAVATVDQVGASALFKLPSKYYDNVKAEYRARRDVVYEELMKIPGVVCQKPGGAFYLTAKLPVDNAEDFLLFLLTKFRDKGESMMFAPAEGFYETPGLGRDEVRIAYVLKQGDMRRGIELLRLGIEAYNNRADNKTAQ